MEILSKEQFDNIQSYNQEQMGAFIAATYVQGYKDGLTEITGSIILTLNKALEDLPETTRESILAQVDATIKEVTGDEQEAN